jgi:GMP synthase-like glutamine amidotransferase
MVHIIQNDPEVPPGNIAENLESMGIPFFVHHPYLADPFPDLRDVSALIVMGGAMGANDDGSHPFLRDLKRFIREGVKLGIPYLGVCLGGQLLAAAMGARVESNRWEELGTLEVGLTADGAADPLFKGVEERLVTFQWHHDSFDIPEGGVLLAGSTACPHQAFRLGERAWGMQFHPEVTEGIIRDWCAWDPATKARTEELVSAWQTHEDAYRATARRLLENFLNAAKGYCGTS